MFVRFLRDFMSDRPAVRTPVRESGPRSRSRSPTSSSHEVRPLSHTSSAPRARPKAAVRTWIPSKCAVDRSMHLSHAQKDSPNDDLDGKPNPPAPPAPPAKRTTFSFGLRLELRAACCVLGSLARDPPSPSM